MEPTKPGGLAKYSDKQVSTVLQKIRGRHKARAKAQDEEKLYVEYRKQQVLSAVQPTIGTLRSGDEVFPERRKGSMEFGERKAHYLSIRPSLKFANYVGRKKGVIEVKPPANPNAIQVTDHATTPDSARSDSARINKSDNSMPQSAKDDKGGRECFSTTKSNSRSKDVVQRENKRGNRADNPLINGQPFWIVDAANETEELTDEDLPVDMDIIERVCNGDLKLGQKPFQKTKFNPFGTMQKFKFDDPLFDRDTTLFTSTVEAVISLQPDNDVQYAVHPPIQHLIKWFDKLQVVYYDPADRARPLEGPFVEELKDIKREKIEKK